MIAALVLGYGQKTDGNIDEQTRDRCRKAIELYRGNEIDRVFLTVSAMKNGIRMADAMRGYLMSQGISGSGIILDPSGGNTAGELDCFQYSAAGYDKLTLISTWYHIPRIIWLACWRWKWSRFSVAVAWRHAHFKGDVLKEFLKLANAIWRPLRSAKVLDPNNN